MPAEVELSLELPEVLIEIYGAKQVRTQIAYAVEAHEAKAHAEAAAKGWAFRGGDRARKGSPYSREYARGTATAQPAVRGSSGGDRGGDRVTRRSREVRDVARAMVGE